MATKLYYRISNASYWNLRESLLVKIDLVILRCVNCGKTFTSGKNFIPISVIPKLSASILSTLQIVSQLTNKCKTLLARFQTGALRRHLPKSRSTFMPLPRDTHGFILGRMEEIISRLIWHFSSYSHVFVYSYNESPNHTRIGQRQGFIELKCNKNYPPRSFYRKV